MRSNNLIDLRPTLASHSSKTSSKLQRQTTRERAEAAADRTDWFDLAKQICGADMADDIQGVSA